MREVLRVNGWIALNPLGEGGGAYVFKVINRNVVTRLENPLRTPWDNREAARVNAQLVAELLADILDGTETVAAAGKVAKNPDHRMKREIEILRDVQHPNLIRMLAYDQSASPSWYVMPVMRGTLNGRKDLSGDLAATVRGMRQVALALAALHAKAITHRDIKPKNIFVSDDGTWILGDPGVAYRDDDGDETTTRPVSKDWAPTWYGDELARTPKADLFMLGKTALSLLVGGDKPLDPTHLSKPKFNLPELFPSATGVREVYDLFRKLIVAESEEMPYADARQLVNALDALLPMVENAIEWRLAMELARIKQTPRTIFTYSHSGQNLASGPVEGLKQVPIFIPYDCTRLIFWPRGNHASAPECGAILHALGSNAVVGEIQNMGNGVPSNMAIPSEARGEYARLTITRQSGLLWSLMVWAERDAS